MKARRLIEGASYEPGTLSLASQAFDQAWVEIGTHFGDDPAVIEAARLRLAHAVLAVVQPEADSVDAVKNAALEIMALAYRDRPALFQRD